jgi:hypothetical protein
MPRRAQATVQIVRAVRATKDECDRLRSNRRRETVQIEAGQPLIVRLIEFE